MQACAGRHEYGRTADGQIVVEQRIRLPPELECQVQSQLGVPGAGVHDGEAGSARQIQLAAQILDLRRDIQKRWAVGLVARADHDTGSIAVPRQVVSEAAVPSAARQQGQAQFKLVGIQVGSEHRFGGPGDLLRVPALHTLDAHEPRHGRRRRDAGVRRSSTCRSHAAGDNER